MQISCCGMEISYHFYGNWFIILWQLVITRDRHDPVLTVTLLLPTYANQTHNINSQPFRVVTAPVTGRILKPQLLSED